MTDKCFEKYFAFPREYVPLIQIALKYFTFKVGYPQRKKSIWGKSGLQVGLLMSHRLEIQKFRTLNSMSRWWCDMLPHLAESNLETN